MSSTSALVLVFFSSGFTIGFGHCIGMCGPIVVSLSLNLRGEKILPPHLFYSMGRCITYALLGGFMGVAGSFTGVVAHIAGFQKAIMILAGVLIILMGLSMGGWLVPVKIFGDDAGSAGFIPRGFKRLATVRKAPAYFPLGLLLGLLPCGPVYTALIGVSRAGMDAGTAGSAFLLGASLMFAFGAGTIPALLLVAKLVDLGRLPSRTIIYKAGAVIMILLGIYFTVLGIRY